MNIVAKLEKVKNDKGQIIYKQFPADTTIEKLTFLNDKKVDEKLYAYFLEISYGINGETVVFKKDLPTQEQLI